MHPVREILKAGLLSAGVATVVSAFVIALFSGAGQQSGSISIPNVWELLKVVVLLCPITVVSAGSFGLLAGALGGVWIYFRRRRIRSVKRFLVETAMIGFLIAFLYPFFDAWTNGPGYYGMVVFAPVFGAPCALICGLVFRRRFMASKALGTEQ